MKMDNLIDNLNCDKWQELKATAKVDSEWKVGHAARHHNQVDDTTLKLLVTVEDGDPLSVNLKDCLPNKDPLKNIGTIEIKLNANETEIVGLDLNGDIVVRKRMKMDNLIDNLNCDKWQELKATAKVDSEWKVGHAARHHNQVDDTTLKLLVTVEDGDPLSVNLKDCLPNKDPLKNIGTIEIKLNANETEIVGLDLNGDIVVRK